MNDGNSSAGKSPYDPGWNDPPVFSYDSRQSAVKGSSLNKRVAYNMDSKTAVVPPTSTTTNSPGQCPPIGIPPAPLLSKSCVEDRNTVEKSQLEKTVDLSIVLENFSKTVEEVYNSGNEKESSVIKKRLELMEKMWNEQKFPTAMQEKLYDLSEGLRRNDIDACDTLQRSVMVDYTSLCSSWMTAIRSLINAKRSKTSL